jgi:dTDP-glucose pyrophosphorylase
MIIKDLKNCFAYEGSSIKSCFINLEKSTKQIIFVINKKKKLLGSLTDGDLRRAILNNYTIKDKIKYIYNKKPIKCKITTSEIEAENIMLSNKINHLPIVDSREKIIGFHSFTSTIEKKKSSSTDFVIMAGGKGKRLKPFTNRCPKPMLKVYGKPILEIIINNAKKQGFKNFAISINYLGDIIKNYFKNGKKFGIKIAYIKEKKPLGTIGALGGYKKYLKSKNIILSNGDVITDINFNSLIKFHESNKSDATMAVYPYKLENPYGEVVTEDTRILEISEKPVSVSYINAGIYIFKKSMLKYLKKNQKMDSVSFFKLLKKKNKKTLAFAVHESWADIGIKQDYLNYIKK